MQVSYSFENLFRVSAYQKDIILIIIIYIAIEEKYPKLSVTKYRLKAKIWRYFTKSSKLSTIYPIFTNFFYVLFRYKRDFCEKYVFNGTNHMISHVNGNMEPAEILLVVHQQGVFGILIRQQVDLHKSPNNGIAHSKDSDFKIGLLHVEQHII